MLPEPPHHPPRSRHRLAAVAGTLGVLALATGVALVVVTQRAYGTNASTWVALWLCAPVVGAVTAALRPRNAVGWLLLAIGLVGVASQVSFAYAPGPRATVPQALLVAAGTPLLMAALLLAAVLVLMFPSGALSRGWRRRLVAATAAVWVLSLPASLLLPRLSSDGPPIRNPLHLSWPGGWPQTATQVATALALAVLAAAAADAIRRLAGSRGATHQQLKWLAYSSLLLIPGMIVASISSAWWAALPLVVGSNGVAASIALAIVRYRLYDIDRLVSRTVSYLIVVGLLTGVYVGCVLLLADVLPLRGSLSVVLAVLVAASLFAPVRRRALAIVDRRFHRSRYSAGAVLEGFSERMGEPVTVEAISQDLLQVVDLTLQPTHTRLWLRAP